jgi:hypothetical protein
MAIMLQQLNSRGLINQMFMAEGVEIDEIEDHMEEDVVETKVI